MKTLNSKQVADQHSAKAEFDPAVVFSPAYGLTRLIAGLILPLLVNFRTEGLENVPSSGPVILAMNHIHWFDIPLASLRVPRISHYMAKVELFSVPLLG